MDQHYNWNKYSCYYIYIYILVSLHRHTDHNEHTRILAVQYLLQTCSVVEQWCHLYRVACTSELLTCHIGLYFVIYIGKYFCLQNIRIRADMILNIRIRIRGCKNLCIRIYILIRRCQKYDIRPITTTKLILIFL